MPRTCHLRLVAWDPESARHRGVPDGLIVEVVDDRALRRDTVVARGTTHTDGRVDLRLPTDLRSGADLYVRTRVPEGTPRHIAPAEWRWARRSRDHVAVPRTWDSRAHTGLERPGRAGTWSDFDQRRVGHPDAPLTFELSHARPRVRPGNRVRALVDGPETLARLEALLRTARHSVHVEMMLWFDDDIGRRMVERLVETAARGVRVRVLLDRDTTEGTHTLTALHGLWVRWLRTVEEPRRSALLAQNARDVAAEKARGDLSRLVRRLRRAEGVDLRISSFPKVFVRTAPDGPLPAAYAALADARPWFNVARIDHRKLIVIDGRIAVVGGMNVGREYLHDTPFQPERTAAEEPWHKWHDVMVELDGPCVRPLQHLFRERWVAEGGPGFSLGPRADGQGQDADHPTFPAIAPHADGRDVRIVSTTPGARTDLAQAYLGLLRRASERVLVATPYFTSEAARLELMAAAERGVRVVLVLPDAHNDSVDFLYAARRHYAELMAAGVEVYEYQGRMTHAKVMVCDDATVVGSANLNRTSFENHYEVAAIIHDAAFAEDFRARVFDVDLPRSRRIRPAHLAALLDLNALGHAWCRTVVDRVY